MNHRFGVAVAMALALAVALPGPVLASKAKHRQKTWTFTFEADTLGHAPATAVIFGGQWHVVSDSTRAVADSAHAVDSAAVLPRVVRQSEDDDGIRFHYIQFPKPVLGDVIVSTRFRILSGEIDPSAGVMFQLDRKGRNGYIVRVSGERGELVAHYLLIGKRRDLRYAKIASPEPGTWHTIEVERVGSVMIARYDGEEKIRLRDERFAGGSVGLWTEDDTVVDFGRFTVSIR